MLFGCLIVSCPLSVYAQSNEELLIDDLRLMTAKVANYQVDGVSPRQALETLLKAALGTDQGMCINIESDDFSKVDEKKMLPIRLDLQNESAFTIIGYIAELSGCIYSIGEWRGIPTIRLARITAAICYEPQLSSAIPCSEKAAKTLGLTKGMKLEEARAVFVRYGAEFHVEGAVFWNPVTHMIAVRGEHTGLVFALVRLAENGWQFSKAEPSQNK